MDVDDEGILGLFARRDEKALLEVTRKFGTHCRRLAMRILGDAQDAEECINDMLMKVWNAIPPAHPLPLAPYLTTMLRRICFDRYQAGKAEKRGGGQMTIALEEMSELLAGTESVESTVDSAALRAAVNHFLSTLSKETRVIFLERYYLLKPYDEIAKKHHMGLSKTKMMVFRTRDRLRSYLEKEGYL